MPTQSSPAVLKDMVDENAADDEAMAEYEAKGGISHQAIVDWVRSWGTEDELSPPNVGD